MRLEQDQIIHGSVQHLFYKVVHIVNAEGVQGPLEVREDSSLDVCFPDEQDIACNIFSGTLLCKSTRYATPFNSLILLAPSIIRSSLPISSSTHFPLEGTQHLVSVSLHLLIPFPKLTILTFTLTFSQWTENLLVKSLEQHNLQFGNQFTADLLALGGKPVLLSLEPQPGGCPYAWASQEHNAGQSSFYTQGMTPAQYPCASPPSTQIGPIFQYPTKLSPCSPVQQPGSNPCRVGAVWGGGGW